jgi:2-keto-3-deoxy-L-rhamnonate aldolase RhmA
MTAHVAELTPAEKFAALTGGTPFICWLDIPSAMSAEIAAVAGFQLALIDLEHGPASVETLQQQLIALKARGARALVRAPETSAVWFKRILDLGPDGLMVPSVNSVEEAKRAIAEFKYPPKGRRGFAAGIIRATDYGAAAENWAARWNATGFLILQIESVAGLHAAPDIAKQDGVDMLFFGPADYATDLGPVAGGQAAVVEAREKMRQIAQSAGKLSGTLARTGEDARSLVAEGWDLAALGSDVLALRQGLESQLAAAKCEA